MIDFEDWEKLEIKIGKVKQAEKIEKSDKLLKLEVDFGDDIRTIVSGIAKKYSPEDVIGKQMPFITNLKPREIFGVESQGMILACHDEEDNPVLLHPDKKVKTGSKIS